MNQTRTILVGDDWHAWRREGVGGSDIAALVGLSRYASPLSLFYEKTGQLPDDRPDTDRQRIGRRMEDYWRRILPRTHWAALHRRPDGSGRTQFHGFARCTVDGLAIESNPDDDDPNVGAVLGTVQFKTDGRFGWPEEYRRISAPSASGKWA